METLQIDPEFKELLRPLSKEEYDELEQMLLQDGCIDPLIVWEDHDIIVDGHNRYQICQKHDISFAVTRKTFSNRLDALIWMTRFQNSRRNLTKEEIMYYQGKRYEFEKQRTFNIGNLKQHQKSTEGVILTPSVSGNNGTQKTSSRLAKEYNIGTKTIKRNANFAKGLDVIGESSPKLKHQILSGKVKVKKQDVETLGTVKPPPKESVEESETPVMMPEFKTVKDISQQAETIKREKQEAKAFDGMVKRLKRVTFNATNDNIEWAKWTWNPVTGCLHGCQYCYARDIANRFYPEKFTPTFHPDRLQAPQFTKIPEHRKDEPGIQNVFVCSMADLFGKWVSMEWIDQVLDAVRQAPQWNFLFLTKNPERYLEIDFPRNCWIGATADTQQRMDRALQVFKELHNRGSKMTFLPEMFVSCEPLSESINLLSRSISHIHPDDLPEFLGEQAVSYLDWIIIGGRSQSSKMGAGQPEWSWVETLLFEARIADVQVYFKPNLTVQPKEYPQTAEKTDLPFPS